MSCGFCWATESRRALEERAERRDRHLPLVTEGEEHHVPGFGDHVLRPCDDVGRYMRQYSPQSLLGQGEVDVREGLASTKDVCRHTADHLKRNRMCAQDARDPPEGYPGPVTIPPRPPVAGNRPCR
jgi:hypothetical protein